MVSLQFHKWNNLILHNDFSIFSQIIPLQSILQIRHSEVSEIAKVLYKNLS